MTTAAGGGLLPGDTRRDQEASARRAGAAEMRRIAGRMEEDNPSWIVVFGVYSRQFVAFPRFSAPSGTVLSALYPDALPPRMRAIEARLRPGVTSGVPRARTEETATVSFRLAG